jgi:pimeloyl-ACP methyl ester carboxylesterase
VPAPRPIVLVHGAFHGAWCWDRLRRVLDERSLPSIAVDLPGHGSSTLPLGDLQADAHHVAKLLADIDDEVVLVGHSYGGGVITEAAGHADNVGHLVYVAAICADVGESVARSVVVEDLPRPELNDALVVADGIITVDPERAESVFYHDCEPADVATAIERLSPQKSASLTQPVTVAAWRTVPSTYILCREDRAIPAALQAVLAKRCNSVVELDASHSPFLSMPEAVADILEPLART